jgi:hypothetical protein
MIILGIAEIGAAKEYIPGGKGLQGGRLGHNDS